MQFNRCLWSNINHRPLRLRLLLASLGLLSGGCFDRPVGLSGGQAVSTIIVPPLDSISSPTWTSRVVYNTLSEDTIAIGEGESLFGRFLPDGSLAIASGPSVLLLNSDGTIGRSLARDGDGPGEFRVITSLGIASDGSLFAADHLSARFTVFSSTGEVRQYIPRLKPIVADLDVYPFAVLPDSRIVAAPWTSRPARRPSPNVGAGTITRDNLPVVTFDSLGDIRDTLFSLSGLERSNGFVAPFSQSALLAGRGQKWVVGISDSLDLTVFDQTNTHMRLTAKRTVVIASRQDRLRRDSLVAEEFGAEVGAAILTRQAEMTVSGVLPNIGGVAIDDEGDIWVGEYVLPGAAERVWHVFGPNGSCIGQLTLPMFGRALVPTRTELLDAAYGRVALLRESQGGGLYVEVREVSRDGAPQQVSSACSRPQGN